MFCGNYSCVALNALLDIERASEIDQLFQDKMLRSRRSSQDGKQRKEKCSQEKVGLKIFLIIVSRPFSSGFVMIPSPPTLGEFQMSVCISSNHDQFLCFW